MFFYQFCYPKFARRRRLATRHDTYSHLSNKRGGGGKIAKSQNVEVGVNVEGGILWKKRMHNSNKRGVEGGKI